MYDQPFGAIKSLAKPNLTPAVKLHVDMVKNAYK